MDGKIEGQVSRTGFTLRGDVPAAIAVLARFRDRPIAKRCPVYLGPANADVSRDIIATRNREEKGKSTSSERGCLSLHDKILLRFEKRASRVTVHHHVSMPREIYCVFYVYFVEGSFHVV